MALMIGVASLITTDLIQESRISTSDKFLIYKEFLWLMFFLAIISYVYRVGSFSGAAFLLRRNTHSWAMVAIAIAMTGWCYHRIEIRSRDYSLVGLEIPLPGSVEMTSESYAMTDAGTIVPLYKLNVTEELFADYVRTSEEKFKSFNHGGIHREHPDRMANCHGWVFTGGRFLLKGHDVENILSDNNYVLVSKPKPDDIVIYRDITGQILHTALVQVVLRDGTIITESKWGIDQRFLHLPADQPYSSEFEYYRTDRPNHLIRILDSDVVDPNLNDG